MEIEFTINILLLTVCLKFIWDIATYKILYRKKDVVKEEISNSDAEEAQKIFDMYKARKKDTGKTRIVADVVFIVIFVLIKFMI